MKKNILAILTIVVAGMPSVVNSQELAKIRDDFFLNPTQQNQPCDPWTRSVIWQIQTGHRGWFYNCDCEECKRFSPYICWKNGEYPCTGETFRKSLRRDFQGIKRRIHDGTCDCQDAHPHHRNAPCNCQNCSAKATVRGQANRSPELLADHPTTPQNPDQPSKPDRVSYRNFVNESPPKPDPNRR